MSSNVRWLLLGTAALSGGQWLQFIILARWLGAAALGSYALALALTAPPMLFAGLQLRTLLASDPKGRYTFCEYRRLTVVTTSLGILASTVIAFRATAAVGGWSVLLAVCAMRAADALADIYHGLWQQQERMSVIGWSRILNSTSSVALVAFALELGGGIPGAAAGSALGSFVALAFMHLRTSADDASQRVIASRSIPVSWRRLGRLAAEGVPLGATLLLGALQTNVPRYFVEMQGGKAALGLFAAASQLTNAGSMFVGALGSAALPRLSSLRASGDGRSFRVLLRKLIVLGFALGAAGVGVSALVGRKVLIFVYRPEFAAAEGMLIVLSVAAAMGFIATLLGYALTAARIIAIQLFILAVTLAAQVLVCVALVSRYGTIGAAWALTVGSAVQAIASEMAMRRARVRLSTRAELLTP